METFWSEEIQKLLKFLRVSHPWSDSFLFGFINPEIQFALSASGGKQLPGMFWE